MALLRITDWDRRYENNRTRCLKKMDWVPVPNRHDGDGYTELVDSPNGAARLGAWLAILQIASRCNPRGTLLRESGRTLPDGGTVMPHTADSLARITRLPVAAFEDAIPKLIEIGWLTECNETISHEPAGIPHDDAPFSSLSGTSMRASDYGREGKGTEGNGTETRASGLHAFLDAYPKQTKLDAAARAYVSVITSDGDHEALMGGLERWKASDQWTRSLEGDGGRFVPDPDKFISERRYLEHPAAYREGGAARHDPFAAAAEILKRKAG